MKNERYIQQKSSIPKKKPVERKVELSKPGSNNYNPKVMEASKKIYTGRSTI